MPVHGMECRQVCLGGLTALAAEQLSYETSKATYRSILSLRAEL